MTLSTLLIMFGTIAAVLTILVGVVMKGHKSWLMTFLQNFCGVWFIFSGWVKAIDPLGTAYKMEDYFEEFYSTLEPTWFGFLAPLFPWMAEHSIWISVVMIIFEIILGLMLVLGHKGKFTSWAFWLLLIFFTILTGFTFLTGYVPSGSNFFEFSSWAAYDKNNMKVTDCGCFGDFLKLEPKVSFFKDLGLLIPAFYFLFRHKDMHQLFSKKLRNIIVGVATIGVLIYSLSNYVWDIPHIDFRPFTNGADVKAVKFAEEEAMANVKIKEWVLKNKASGEIERLSNKDFMDNFANYPKSEWEYLDQIKTEPTMEPTKISEMEFTEIRDGYDIVPELLEEDNYSLMVISYKVKADVRSEMISYQDTTYLVDTTTVFDKDTKVETIQIVRSIDKITAKQKKQYIYDWDSGFEKNYKESIAPLSKAAIQDGLPVRIVVGGSEPAVIEQLAIDTGLGDVVLCSADDILLKTIVRSNPGVLLWKNGKIIRKWHISKFPGYADVKSKYMN